MMSCDVTQCHVMSLVGLDSLCAPFLSLNFNDEGKWVWSCGCGLY